MSVVGLVFLISAGPGYQVGTLLLLELTTGRADIT